MMISDEEKRLYQERAQAYYDEYMAVPESKRSEFVLNIVNEAFMNYSGINSRVSKFSLENIVNCES